MERHAGQSAHLSSAFRGEVIVVELRNSSNHVVGGAGRSDSRRFHSAEGETNEVQVDRECFEDVEKATRRWTTRSRDGKSREGKKEGGAGCS